MDMRRMGLYVSRKLSFDNCEFEICNEKLSPAGGVVAISSIRVAIL